MWVSQAFLPVLREHSGRVIHIGSRSGTIARPFRGDYTISKFALEGLADTMRRELIWEGLSVSMVNPGFIRDTNIGRKGQQATREKYGSAEDRKDLTADQKTRLRQFQFTLRQAMDQWAPLPQDSSTPAILHALRSRHPRTRYHPGITGSGGKWLASLPAWFCPYAISYIYCQHIKKGRAMAAL